MADAPSTEPDPDSQLTSPVTDPPDQVTKIVTPEGKAKAGKFDVGQMMGDGPTMPSVQQHAIDAAREDAAASQPSNNPGVPIKGKTDDLGRAFDPKIHEGEGVLNREGFLKKRRGAAAQRAAATSSGNTSFAQSASNQSKLDVGGPAPVDKKTQAAEELEAKINSTAVVSAHVIFTVGQMVGGPEFKPEESEVSGMTAAFAEYYRVRGIVDLPPEVMLGTAIIGYVVPRWNKPIFKERRLGWWARWKSKREERNLHPHAIRPDPQ